MYTRCGVVIVTYLGPLPGSTKGQTVLCRPNLIPKPFKTLNPNKQTPIEKEKDLRCSSKEFPTLDLYNKDSHVSGGFLHMPIVPPFCFCGFSKLG